MRLLIHLGPHVLFHRQPERSIKARAREAAERITNSQTDDLLLQILRWIRASSFASVQRLVEQEFKKGSGVDEVKVKIYQLSDGKATSVGIAKAANVSQSLVSRLWKRWRQMGIAETGEGGRTLRSFSLDAFGLTVGSAEDETE